MLRTPMAYAGMVTAPHHLAAQTGLDVKVVEAFADVMGHAGAIVLHPDGLMEGASDPRSDGTVVTR